MKTHDLTHLIKYTSTPLPTRLYIGHYGDRYVLPRHCILTKTTIKNITYGFFRFTHPSGEKIQKTIKIYYTDDELKTYEKFINKLAACKPFCDIVHPKLAEKGEYGKISKSTYVKIGLPQIKGVALNTHREESYIATTTHNGHTVTTHININLSKDDIINKIKEHLAKLPQEWKDKRHIPEVYLK